MLVRDLSTEGWTVRPVGDLGEVPASLRQVIVPARVPGCVHTDLMRAGLIADPRVGMNELDVQWIGRTDWEYRAEIEIGGGRPGREKTEHERLDLVCDGLDTIAEVSLSGVRVGTAQNAHHPHRFDLRQAARAGGTGGSVLSIVFRSPIRHIHAERERLGELPHNGDSLGWEPFNFIRKPACNFGWDWSPRVATCGVCGPIRVEAWSGVRVAGVRPLVRRKSSTLWTVDVHVDLEWAAESDGVGARSITVTLRSGDDGEVRATAALRPRQSQVQLSLEVDEPRLWWPRGHGEQPTYRLELGLDTSTEPDRTAAIAFREVRLNTDADEHGHKFQIEVNGKPIFCKGANWIPEGLFPDDRAPEKIRQRVRQAAEANMNMLRVWGGGMYESEAFYDECDARGIMVWQDFMFACACYPEEQPYPRLIEEEARHQIARLSAHPSVVLWCGGNECVWGYETWGKAENAPWKERVGGRTWGRGYYFELLPRLMRELDPTRPYWANSPFSGREGDSPNQQDRGDRHTWDVRAEGYAKLVPPPRFCSEFGHQSPPGLPALARVLRAEDLAINSAGMVHRQRGTGGMARHIDECLAEHFPVPREFEEWHRVAQLMQSRALEIGIEALGAARPRCMGALIWQLNDAWPGMSWSLIDSEGVPKPAYYVVKAAFARITP